MDILVTSNSIFMISSVFIITLVQSGNRHHRSDVRDSVGISCTAYWQMLLVLMVLLQELHEFSVFLGSFDLDQINYRLVFVSAQCACIVHLCYHWYILIWSPQFFSRYRDYRNDRAPSWEEGNTSLTCEKLLFGFLGIGPHSSWHVLIHMPCESLNQHEIPIVIALSFFQGSRPTLESASWVWSSDTWWFSIGTLNNQSVYPICVTVRVYIYIRYHVYLACI